MWAGISVCNGFYAGVVCWGSAKPRGCQSLGQCLEKHWNRSAAACWASAQPHPPTPPFHPGNIATLSFGALAVNDVFAAVVTLLFCEVVTHLYYTDTTGSLTLWYLNCFKIGLIAALLADAVKLGS